MNKIENIAHEIIAMAEEDQQLRMQSSKDSTWRKNLDEIDKKNTTKMKEIIAEQGWPTISKVGEKASHAAWLLVQHTDHDVNFQQHFLALMESEPEGEVRRSNLAFLTDRIRINKKQLQVYGTQFRMTESGWKPYPLEDIENVNKLRAGAGLQTLEENLAEIKEGHIYGTKTSSL